MNQECANPRLGELYLAQLRADKNIQGGSRPVVIIQNNVGNLHSPTVEVVPVTSRIYKARYMPTHVYVRAEGENGLVKDSVLLAEQAVTINKERLLHRIGRLNRSDLVSLGRARAVQSPLPIQ